MDFRGLPLNGHAVLALLVEVTVGFVGCEDIYVLGLDGVEDE